MRPGTEVNRAESPTPRAVPTNTATWFVTGEAERGPLEPVLVTSFEQFKRRYGGRFSGEPVLYDSLEHAFTNGLSRACISRVVGPDAEVAAAEVYDQDGSTKPGDVTLTVEALDAGEWGNGLNVEIDPDDDSGTTFVIIVTHDDVDGTLERSPTLADRQAAVDWSERSDYIRFGLGATSTEDPRAQTVSLTGGTDDRANITDAEWDVARDLFDRRLGPGQISDPGRTTSEAHEAVFTHATASNRRALCDLPNTNDQATLEAGVAAIRALGVTARDGGCWGNYLTVRGPAANTTKVVPPSATVAALIARSDRQNSPNVPAAGLSFNNVPGDVRGALGIVYEASDAVHEELNAAGVNLFRVENGQIVNWGFRTAADPTEDEHWLQLSKARLFMAVIAAADAVGKRYVFAEVDGGRHKLSQFEGDLVAEALMPFYRAGSLYGSSPEEAFACDATSVAANPDDQLAQGIMRGLIYLRVSPYAELVRLELADVPITYSLPA